MRRALKPCSTPDCPELVEQGACAACKSKRNKAYGSATQRGYGRQHKKRFRPQVLRRDPLCVCDDQSHGHGRPCLAQSTDADHWPLTKRELRARGMDDNDPAYGRGLCSSCHGKATAADAAQRGGWHAQHHAASRVRQ